MNARELVEHLTLELGRSDADAALMGEIVESNWVSDPADLYSSSIKRLEALGFPLRLAVAIKEDGERATVDGVRKSTMRVVNYSVKPLLYKYWSGPRALVANMHENAMKRRDPTTWAVLRLQRAYRRRLARRNDPACFSRDAPEKEDEEDSPGPSKEEDAPKRGAEAAEAEEDEFREVELAMRKIAKELGRTEFDVKPAITTLVGQNWIARFEDLKYVEERHWRAWKIPYALERRLVDEAEVGLSAWVGNMFGKTEGKADDKGAWSLW